MPSNIKKRGVSLYPVEDFEALNIDSLETSDDDEREGLDPEKEAEIDEKAAIYEENRYYPDERCRPMCLSSIVPTVPPLPVAPLLMQHTRL